MRKIAYIFVALTYIGACIGMWSLTWIALNAYKRHLPGSPLPALTYQVLEIRNALPFLAVPYVIWCFAILRRPAPNSDLDFVFAAISAFVLSAVFFFLVVVLLLPVIMIINF